MLITLKWLESLLNKKLELQRLKNIALNVGLEIEEAKSLAPANIRLGRIEKIKPHPKLKGLLILEVKTNKKVQIVTAAQNIELNNFVLVGLAGTRFNGKTIIEKDFNGIKSQGMLISEQELGIADKSTGVITFDSGKPGDLFANHFDDLVLDFSTTPNRPDWLSVEGIARTLAIGLNLNKPLFSKDTGLYRPNQKNTTGNFPIKILDLTGCPRYTARIFDKVTVQESPFWLKWRLHCMGMSNVNNIVDITNYMMLLTGQPLHPFDLDLIDDCIIIRRAKTGEKFITLEGTELSLSSKDLVIADKNKPVALAGIIGAQYAQISKQTKRLLLESAYFDARTTAHTSRRLGILTEASMRFERGGDISAVDKISWRTGRLFKQFANARETEFIACGKKGKAINIKFSLAKLNQILALNLKRNEVKKYLKKLEISVTGGEILNARIPHFRRDLLIEEDIYEEVARVYGYMNIPDKTPGKWGGTVHINKTRIFEEKIKHYLLGQGYSEAITLSLIARSKLLNAGFEKFVTIKNPLNERFDALRPTLFFGLLDCVNYNLSKGNRSLRFFEIGNILLPEEPYQEKRLGLIVGGEHYPDFWDKTEHKIDYYDLKGLVENIFRLLHIKDIKLKETQRKGFTQAANFLLAEKTLGYIGCIDNTLCKQSYYYAELNLEKLLSLTTEICYIPPAKYPATIRDLSFLVNQDIEVPDLIELINAAGGPIIEKVVLFDYYKGKAIPADKKNLGFRLHFRSPDRTLTDAEVDQFITKIEQELASKAHAKLRKKE